MSDDGNDYLEQSGISRGSHSKSMYSIADSRGSRGTQSSKSKSVMSRSSGGSRGAASSRAAGKQQKGGRTAQRRAQAELMRQAEEDMAERLRSEIAKAQELQQKKEQNDSTLRLLKERRQTLTERHQAEMESMQDKVSLVRREAQKVKVANEKKEKRIAQYLEELKGLRTHLRMKRVQLARYFVPSKLNIDVEVHPLEIFSSDFFGTGEDDEAGSPSGISVASSPRRERPVLMIEDQEPPSSSEGSDSVQADEEENPLTLQRNWAEESSLHDPAFVHAVVRLLNPRHFTAGAEVIRQGDAGSEMFFLTRGDMTVLVQKGADERPQYVADLGMGDFFGEVSVLFDVERTATVIARTDCSTLVMSKEAYARVMATFTQQSKLIKCVARKRLDLWIANVLRNAPCFAAAGKNCAAEAAAAAELLRPMSVAKGSLTLRQGDVGLEMFIICSGLFKVVWEGVELKRLGPGDVIGEQALIHRERRSANVSAVKASSLLVLPWKVFARWQQVAPYSYQELVRISDVEGSRPGYTSLPEGAAQDTGVCGDGC
eukprot:TRINITY_DN18195_c0_g1_i1.p1 TRINITY_DN18195_c0_g1~~TRINITY_DN18195_c0_g1_i1.p1  ORF type:complete len:562 (+),score=183.64 TRINITY_DN18195_c0_g1_i1:57-1688(+)